MNNKKIQFSLLFLFFIILIPICLTTNQYNGMATLKTNGNSQLSGLAYTETLWASNGMNICTEINQQTQIQVIADGLGGAIITWKDTRSAGGGDIYAAKITSNGSLLWNPNGTLICNYPYSSPMHDTPQICSDGAGGAIIGWFDYSRNGWPQIYAQRVNSAGTTLWKSNGTAVYTQSGSNQDLRLCSDGSGGAIFIWSDNRTPKIPFNYWNIYAQRLNATGGVVWKSSGVPICNASGIQTNPQLVSDGAGGAIIVWEDNRNITNSWDIYAQRIDANGVLKWNANGTSIYPWIYKQCKPQLIRNEFGDILITWEDWASFNHANIMIQKRNLVGVEIWTRIMAPKNCNQTDPQLCSDMVGGAIVTWQDDRNGLWDIYINHLPSNGLNSWASYGLVICDEPGSQYYPQICSDGDGGAFLVWKDDRSMTGAYDVYGQWVNSSGGIRGDANGMAICTLSSEIDNPQIVNNELNRAIIVWEDYRSSTWDIYAQLFKGTPPEEPPVPGFSLVLILMGLLALVMLRIKIKRMI
jgi:hypothetical protein